MTDTTAPSTLSGKVTPAGFLAGLRKRLAQDRWVAWTVRVSGFSVIFVILAIFFVIALEVLPLFQAPEVALLDRKTLAVGAPVFALGTEEYRNVGYVADARGLRFFSLQAHREFPPVTLPDLEGAAFTTASHPQKDLIVFGLSDGRALPVQVRFEVTFPESGRRVTPHAEAGPFIPLDPDGAPVTTLAHFKSEDGVLIAAVTGPSEVTAVLVVQKKNLMGQVRTRQVSETFPVPNQGDITALEVAHDLQAVYAATATGQVIRLGWPSDENEGLVEILGATPDPAVPIRVMRFLKGGSTLVLGDETGRVYSSQIVPQPDGHHRLDIIHRFERHPAAVTRIDYSKRDKGFVTAGAAGRLSYHYATSGETEYHVDSGLGGETAGLVLAPKGDGLLAIDQGGGLGHWAVDNPHPGITFKTLFGKVRYEGYEKPEYTWQSTGGTDEFEPKLSLTPLIFGTLKGTFYAMIFAAPLALLAAFYTSQFMHRSLMSLVKPTVEFMAALPSVVLGFFAALWLAPRVEELFPALVMMPLVVVLLILGLQYLSERTPLPAYLKNAPRAEFGLLLALVLVGGGLSILAGSWVEATLLNGDFRMWLLEAAGLSYDQRNSVVVGMAMGFAVVPIIFTIAEDSLSSVPQLLSAGSLALGATRWQTAVRVVLPTASPGIFSALMIGFGRAVGETMIVLMATGNTPVMDWSPFSGFRALSANIAVELPEAPEGGTLFRILFLAALLLFLFTFAVNSAAEWIRLKLREKYRVL